MSGFQGKTDEYRSNYYNDIQTFSGFDWCLNRENLIVTYSKKSSVARFWDLAIYGESPYQYKPEEIKHKDRSQAHTGFISDNEIINKPRDISAAKVLLDEYRSFDCKDSIYSLAWKPRNTSLSNSLDKNKFVIFSGQGLVEEFTFFEKNFLVLDMSCKGDLAMSMQNPLNLNNTLNGFNLGDTG